MLHEGDSRAVRVECLQQLRLLIGVRGTISTLGVLGTISSAQSGLHALTHHLWIQAATKSRLCSATRDFPVASPLRCSTCENGECAFERHGRPCVCGRSNFASAVFVFDFQSGVGTVGGGEVGEIVGKMLLSKLEQAEEKLDDGVHAVVRACCSALWVVGVGIWFAVGALYCAGPRVHAMCVRVASAELHRLESVDEDDLEAARRKRLEQMKRVHKQKQEWLGEACGRAWPSARASLQRNHQAMQPSVAFL